MGRIMGPKRLGPLSLLGGWERGETLVDVLLRLTNSDHTHCTVRVTIQDTIGHFFIIFDSRLIGGGGQRRRLAAL